MSIDTQRRSRWPVMLVAGGLAGLIGFAALLTYLLGGAGTVLDALGGNSSTDKSVSGEMGKPATDGEFEFTVTKVTCGMTRLGDGVPKKAQGQFCLVDVAVTNNSTSAEVFSDLSQTAYDTGGAEYAVDSAALVSANKANPAILAPVAPGATARGRLVFDVPVGTKLTTVVLHESMFSAGVKIPLS
jgi:hypothetical protein